MLMNKLLEYLGLDDDGIMASCEQPVGEVTWCTLCNTARQIFVTQDGKVVCQRLDCVGKI